MKVVLILALTVLAVSARVHVSNHISEINPDPFQWLLLGDAQKLGIHG